MQDPTSIPPPPPPPPVAPSATALGKRPISQLEEPSEPSTPIVQPVQQVIKREKRITRSSLPNTNATSGLGLNREGGGEGGLGEGFEKDLEDSGEIPTTLSFSLFLEYKLTMLSAV